MSGEGAESDVPRCPSYKEVMAAIDEVISAVHSDSELEDALYEHMTKVVRAAVPDRSIPPRPPLLKKGDRVLVRRTPGRDVVMVVDDVSDPDADGVRRATMHQEDTFVADLYGRVPGEET